MRKFLLAAVATFALGGAAHATGTFGPYQSKCGRVVKYASPDADYMTECMPLINGSHFSGPFPIVLLIHGGGWKGGVSNIGPAYNGYSGSWAQYWASWGYETFSINYRLIDKDYKIGGVTKKGAWHDAALDVQAAMRYVKLHASDFNANKSHVTVMGDSAGGSLAQLLAWSNTNYAGDISGENAGPSPQAQFLISAFGVYGGPSDSVVPGTKQILAKSLADGLSPAASFFIHGTNDTTVNISNSKEPYCLLKGKHPTAFIVYPGGHEFTGLPSKDWNNIVGGLLDAAAASNAAHVHYFKAMPDSEPGGPPALLDIKPDC